GQDSTPTEQDEEELSILSGNSNLVYSTSRSQESSPEDGPEMTSNGDTSLYNKLLEHFKGVEWDQAHYQPSPEEIQSFTQHSMTQANSGLFNGNPAFKGPSVQTISGLDEFDYGIFNPLPALAPGQLPMPIDGVNYNFSVQQEQQSDDPLEFLSKQNPIPTFGQSWDYSAE
ncbi:16635_t:CDS:1, partial [Acaulospora colombiana]